MLRRKVPQTACDTWRSFVKTKSDIETFLLVLTAVILKSVAITFLGGQDKLGYVCEMLLLKSIYRVRQPPGSSQPTTRPL